MKDIKINGVQLGSGASVWLTVSMEDPIPVEMMSTSSTSSTSSIPTRRTKIQPEWLSRADVSLPNIHNINSFVKFEY